MSVRVQPAMAISPDVGAAVGEPSVGCGVAEPVRAKPLNPTCLGSPTQCPTQPVVTKTPASLA